MPQPFNLQLYWKNTPTQVFSLEFCEIFKNIFFDRASLVAASRRDGRGSFCNEKIWLLHILLIQNLQSSDRKHLKSYSQSQILKAILKLISCVLTSSHYTKPVIKSLEKNSLLKTYKPILQLFFKYFHPQTGHASKWLLSLCTRSNYLFI